MMVKTRPSISTRSGEMLSHDAGTVSSCSSDCCCNDIFLVLVLQKDESERRHTKVASASGQVGK